VLRGRRRTLTAEGLRAFVRRLEATFAGRCVRSFLELQGIDRALVLASQAFTALIPLVLLGAALAPADHQDGVSTALIDRFRLTGGAADSVQQLFAHSGSSSVGIFSGLLLLFSGVSLTRRMQRMYQQTWRLPPAPGVGHTLHAGLGLAALLLGIGLLYQARALVQPLPLQEVWQLGVSAVAGFLVWTAVPWLLLDRRLAWRRMVPGGLLTALCSTSYGIASTVYMPRLLETYSRRYGLFGVTLALIGWLVCIAFIVVGATTVAAEFDRAPDRWARAIRSRVGIEPVAVAQRPAEPAGDGPDRDSSVAGARETGTVAPVVPSPPAGGAPRGASRADAT
jgi:membrane protein